VVFPHTYQVRDYAPKLAARLGQVLIGDVTGFAEGPVFVRQLCKAASMALTALRQRTLFVSVQAGAFVLTRPKRALPQSAISCRYRAGADSHQAK